MADYADLTRPFQTLFTSGTSSSAGALQVPLKQISSEGSVYEAKEGRALKVPFRTILASDTAAELERPFQEFDGSGVIPITASFDKPKPAISASLSGIVNLLGEASLTRPVQTIFGNVFISISGTGELKRPFVSLKGLPDGGILVGGASLIVPIRRLVSSGYMPISGDAELTRIIERLEAAGIVGALTHSGTFILMNTKNRAVSKYTDYSVWDFVYCNGVMYGIGSDGLYELDSETDDTSQKTLRLPSFDMAKQGLLYRPRFVYMNLDGTNGTLTFNEYTYPFQLGDIASDVRVKLGKGFKERIGNLSLNSVFSFILRSLDIDAYVVRSKRR